MPPNLDQYIKLSDAPKKYNVSNTTLRRKRNRAREAGDNDTYSHFLIKTRDGDFYEQPLAEVINKLVTDGKLPEWYVDHLWLESQFRVRPSQTTPDQPVDSDHDASSPPTNKQPDQSSDTSEHQPKKTDHPDASLPPETQAIIQAYETQITDLQKRLDDAGQERKSMRQEYRETITNLTGRMLPAEAKQASQNSKQQGTAQTKPVDTTPKVQVVKVTPKKAETSPKKEQVKAGRRPIRDFLFGSKE